MSVGLTTPPRKKQVSYGNYNDNHIVVVALCPIEDEEGKKNQMGMVYVFGKFDKLMLIV